MSGGIWVRCFCSEYWCLEHSRHVSGCACPEIGEWEEDPYKVVESQEMDMPRLLKQAQSHLNGGGPELDS